MQAKIKIQLRDLCLSKLWKSEMENIWLCCNDVGECDTLDSPWTIKCTNSPKDSQRPLPVNKLCLGPAPFIRQQQKAADKRPLASFVVHCTSSRQPLLWAVLLPCLEVKLFAPVPQAVAEARRNPTANHLALVAAWPACLLCGSWGAEGPYIC